MAEHYTGEDFDVATAAILGARHDYQICAGFGRIDPTPTERRHARAVLDAVAPAIAARAVRGEASRLRKIATHGADGEADPYETADWLDRRADEIEGR